MTTVHVNNAAVMSSDGDVHAVSEHTSEKLWRYGRAQKALAAERH